jgi:hypothetical protein
LHETAKQEDNLINFSSYHGMRIFTLVQSIIIIVSLVCWVLAFAREYKSFYVVANLVFDRIRYNKRPPLWIRDIQDMSRAMAVSEIDIDRIVVGDERFPIPTTTNRPV